MNVQIVRKLLDLKRVIVVCFVRMVQWNVHPYRKNGSRENEWNI
ncbi:MAG: hypothetical protein PHY57_09490 [Ignavibacterium sp.]|nr:hypothetical protein [Ignavibacterium sp.]